MLAPSRPDEKSAEIWADIDRLRQKIAASNS